MNFIVANPRCACRLRKYPCPPLGDDISLLEPLFSTRKHRLLAHQAEKAYPIHATAVLLPDKIYLARIRQLVTKRRYIATCGPAQCVGATIVAMGFAQDIAKKLPTAKSSIDTIDRLSRNAEKMEPRLAFVRRRFRLKSDSSFSVPVVIVLLFPCLAIGLISVLFMRTPDTENIMNMPAGTPPSIR